MMFKSARGVALESAPVSLMAPVADMAYAEMAPEAPKSPAAPLRKRFAKLVALNRALLVRLQVGLRLGSLARRWGRRPGAHGSACRRTCRAMSCAWWRCRKRRESGIGAEIEAAGWQLVLGCC